jgi:DNA-binding LacI/PurR family transcriptional regulator
MELTTVRQDVAAVGEEAVRILLALLKGEQGPIRRTLPTQLVVGRSTVRSTRSGEEMPT